MIVTLVPGTWGWTDDRNQWWHPGSAFVGQLLSEGAGLVSCERPFVWSTDVNGLIGDSKHRDWRSCGVGLYQYIVPALCPEKRVPPAETVVLAHSHGGQGALYAAAEGLKIDLLVTIATPVRRDMEAVARAARPNIRQWRHLYCAGWKDYMQALGGLFDGSLGVVRQMPLADENINVPGAGHSGMVKDATYLPRWSRGEWLRRP